MALRVRMTGVVLEEMGTLSASELDFVRSKLEEISRLADGRGWTQLRVMVAGRIFAFEIDRAAETVHVLAVENAKRASRARS